ncbi:MAG: sugar-binding protein, partial [Armatimonadota bacterium]
MRKIAAVWLFVLLCCYPGLSAETPARNLGAAGPAGDPPAIDGELNDACWQSPACARLTHFVTPDMTRLARPQTEALVCFDAAYLYIAVRCDEPKPSALAMEQTDRDARVWQDDCIEFFIDTNHDHQTFHQVVINPRGTVFDRESETGKDWDADIQVAADTGDDAWWVECAIPFADLGGAPETGETWGFNVCRERRVQEELSTWAPTYGAFPQPERFGELVFTDLPAVPSLTMLREPMFGLNEISLSGPQGTAADVHIVHEWPAGTPAPWDYPPAVVQPVTRDGADAPNEDNIQYTVQYRIVDGSEREVQITQSLEEDTLLRQTVPVSIQPRPQIVDLVASRLPALKRYAKNHTEFGAQIEELVTATREKIDEIVQSNLTRDGLMAQKEWEQAVQQLSRAIDLPY